MVNICISISILTQQDANNKKIKIKIMVFTLSDTKSEEDSIVMNCFSHRPNFVRTKHYGHCAGTQLGSEWCLGMYSLNANLNNVI
jgi:hypothetical protein